jgi:DNA polymerase-3 subunit gamma/tau
MLGSVDRGHAVRLVQALSVRDGRAVLDAVDALRTLGLSAAGALEEMARLLQQMAVCQAVPDALDAGDPDHEDALRLAPVLAADETQLLYGIVLQGRAELSLMSDEYAALTMVLLRFLAFPSLGTAAAAPVATVAPAAPRAAAAAAAQAPHRPTPVPTVQAQPPAARAPEPARRSAEPEIPPWVDDGPPPDADDDARSVALRAPAPPALKIASPRPSPAGAMAQPVPAASAPQTSALGDRWSALVQGLAERGRIGALVRELAWQAGVQTCVESDAGCEWILTVERETLRADSLRERLEAALSEELGGSQRLTLEPGVPLDSVARREAWQRQRRQAEAEQLVRDDPAVQALLAEFETARIVPGTVRPL